MRYVSGMRFSLVGLAVFSLVSCGARSEDEIQGEFDDFVEKNNECSAAADCVIVGADCPLGCWVAVNESRVSAVQSKARELIDEYESEGRACDYNCVQAANPTCEAGHCRAETYSGSGDAGPAPIQ